MIRYFDLGVYEGRELDEFLGMGFDCECYGFEAHPEKAKALQEKYAGVDNVQISWSAVANYWGTAYLYLHPGQGSSIFSSKNNVDPNNFVEVPCVSLSQWIKNEFPIGISATMNILRFNIEGAELPMLMDLVESGMYQDFDFFLGAEPGADIKKVAEIAHRYEQYLNLLKTHDIEILPWCYNIEKVDLKSLIEKKLEERK